ncbi:MAG: UDP-N-acetylglucosamine 2-epimerase (non-hydrolyzing) [Lachnospiraceae bacterium]|nr:UDP-N-acetylglucosamine 2-epimerase (non-hydrolyzing) [Lachnospiraceae bacterium]
MLKMRRYYKMIKVMSIFGTRPEAIKMCPLVKELEKHSEINSIVCLTGQHREMLQQVIDIFGIKVAYNLDIMRPEQTLTTITTDVLEKMESVLAEEKPNIVLVHGDTTTSFVAALAAFYQQIPVGHVEAGLRTFDKYSPFPEEMNRSLTGRIAEFHFAPTENNRKNLENENIKQNIFVTGNTVIDAFQTTVKEEYQYKVQKLNCVDTQNRRCILMTAHRRENLGKPLENICKAVKRLVMEFEDIEVVYPVHLNPAVQNTVHDILGGVERVHLIQPLDVEDMHNLISRSYLVMTDSGGLQEEAPACGVPVLVLRTETERPEAVEAGTVEIVGVNEDDIYNNARRILTDKEQYEKMARAVNPYGDGHASKRIVEILLKFNASKNN